MWSYRDGGGQQQYSGRLQCVNDAQLLLRGPKWAKTMVPHHYQPDPGGPDQSGLASIPVEFN